VFADYYLFDELPGGAQSAAEQVTAYLHRLKLAHKVGIRDGKFTTTDLSTGQRKRLALINAWLEQRPVLLFDEWAADQDPEFRRLFYMTLLPELKAAGKTIIAVSHDDRYFDVADHIVHMECGRVRMERGARYKKEAVGS
ncbi:MAG TPA: ATP-binding cassette domain-containing protein, partial [Steroidobacter sp.]|nr:ATP-binding cassette domain-containing protein [Steroidobacter sp.]